MSSDSTVTMSGVNKIVLLERYCTFFDCFDPTAIAASSANLSVTSWRSIVSKPLHPGKVQVTFYL